MSLPPPDNWRPPQPPPRPLQGPPFGLPPSTPQQPPGPPNRGNGLKWVLGALVLLVVVAVSVGATLLFTRGGSGDAPPIETSGPPTTSGVASDVASANDVGPVGIITEDPSAHRGAPSVTLLPPSSGRAGTSGIRRFPPPHGHRNSGPSMRRSDERCALLPIKPYPWRNLRPTVLCANCMNKRLPIGAHMRTPSLNTYQLMTISH